MFSLALIRYFRRCEMEIEVTFNPSWIPFKMGAARWTQPQDGGRVWLEQMMLGFLSQREMWAPVVGWHKGASFRWLIEHPSLTPACGFGAWGIKEKFNKRFFLVCGLNNWICGIATPVSSLVSSFSLPFRPAFWSGCPVCTHLTRVSTVGAETKSGTSLAVWARLYTRALD